MSKPAVTLRSEYLEEIPRTPSWKYPYVVSHVPLELLHGAIVALHRLPLP